MTTEEFIAGLKPDLVIPIERVDDRYEWTCTCGHIDGDTTETRSSMKLYFHLRSGHVKDIRVETPGGM